MAEAVAAAEAARERALDRRRERALRSRRVEVLAREQAPEPDPRRAVAPGGAIARPGRAREEVVLERQRPERRLAEARLARRGEERSEASAAPAAPWARPGSGRSATRVAQPSPRPATTALSTR